MYIYMYIYICVCVFMCGAILVINNVCGIYVLCIRVRIQNLSQVNI